MYEKRDAEGPFPQILMMQPVQRIDKVIARHAVAVRPHLMTMQAVPVVLGKIDPWVEG